jgi:hypothetical protein
MYVRMRVRMHACIMSMYVGIISLRALRASICTFCELWLPLSCYMNTRSLVFFSFWFSFHDRPIKKRAEHCVHASWVAIEMISCVARLYHQPHTSCVERYRYVVSPFEVDLRKALVVCMRLCRIFTYMWSWTCYFEHTRSRIVLETFRCRIFMKGNHVLRLPWNSAFSSFFSSRTNYLAWLHEMMRAVSVGNRWICIFRRSSSYSETQNAEKHRLAREWTDRNGALTQQIQISCYYLDRRCKFLAR